MGGSVYGRKGLPLHRGRFLSKSRGLTWKKALSFLLTVYFHRVPVTLHFLPVLYKLSLYIFLHWFFCQVVVGSVRRVERGWKPDVILS